MEGNEKMSIKITKGLDILISGVPAQEIHQAPLVKQVALLGEEYNILRPSLCVAVGDRVKKGQPLLTDKDNPGVFYTAGAGGNISAINRGERRVLQSIVIDIEEEEEQLTFSSYLPEQLTSLSADAIKENLATSGLWGALRTRPFSRTPKLDSTPNDLFVTAMDTNPLAADPVQLIRSHAQDFLNGLTLLTRLTEGKVYLCSSTGAELPSHPSDQVVVKTFSGPHPAGLVGTHIHFLSPVSGRNMVWHIGYQEVIAFGKLFTTGQIYSERVVALGGPRVKQPCLLHTRLGANLQQLTNDLMIPGDNRLLSGSPLSGRVAAGAYAFLGCFHNQVSVLPEGRDRELFGWIRPGGDKFSLTRTLSSCFNTRKRLALTTALHGGARSMVPIGSYERVMPLDILPTPLLRELIIGDSENAQALGCLELDEEDLALCSFVCPGKYEYGPMLRTLLRQIEKEG